MSYIRAAHNEHTSFSLSFSRSLSIYLPLSLLKLEQNSFQIRFSSVVLLFFGNSNNMFSVMIQRGKYLTFSVFLYCYCQEQYTCENEKKTNILFSSWNISNSIFILFMTMKRITAFFLVWTSVEFGVPSKCMAKQFFCVQLQPSIGQWTRPEE